MDRDRGRDLDGGRADGADRRDGVAGVVDEVGLDEVEVLPVDCGEVPRGDAGEIGGEHRGVVHLHVVGVAVHPVVVVGHDGDGAFFGGDRRDLLGGGGELDVDVGPPRALRRAVVDAGVDVIEEDQAVDTQDGARAFGFGAASRRDVGGRAVAADAGPEFARRRHQHNGAVPGAGERRDRSAREDGFVVGVRVHEHHAAPIRSALVVNPDHVGRNSTHGPIDPTTSIRGPRFADLDSAARPSDRSDDHGPTPTAWWAISTRIAARNPGSAIGTTATT